MTDKSGGDIAQANMGAQGNLSGQTENVVAPGGAGIVDGIGGMGGAMGAAQQAVNQAQAQGNMAMSGDGGDDNINANTNINIS
ncbi:MAG: hypothetical protein KDJ38_01165 [Gammaproteobacteria bacterium]|nr:hypothetical protein [Gammaproteobacteria bacterium]